MRTRSLPLALLTGLAAALLSSPAVAAPAPDPDLELTLDQALERFRSGAPTVAELAARVEEARAGVRLATAAALPILAAQGGYTRNNAEAKVSIRDAFDALTAALPVGVDVDTSALPGTLIIQPQEVFSGGASLTVPLVAASAWADISAAREGAKAAEAQQEVALRAAEVALTRAAWLCEVAEVRVAASQHAAETAASHLATAERRRDAGLGTTLDVLSAKVAVTQRQGDALQAVADLSRARRAVAALLGVAGTVDVVVPEVRTAALPSVGEASDRAISFRPELTAAASSWKVANRQATAAWLRHLPTVSAFASVAGQTVPFPTGLDYAWKVGVQATWVMYDGGARYGMLRRARAQRAQAEAVQQRVRLDVARDAADAVDAVGVAKARRDLAESALTTADEAEASAARAYGAGLLSASEVLDVQQRRLDAAVAQAAARAQVGVARADLVRALGTSR